MDSGKKRKKLMVAITSWMVVAIFVGILLNIPNTPVDRKPILAFDDKNVAAPTIYPPSRKINSITGQTSHAPITISGDAAFTSANGVSAGTGSESDPYIIANWFIDGSGRNCIWIVDTTKHFIIENCTLINATYVQPFFYVGISLFNVSNGHIRSNECNTSTKGISLHSSSSNTLTNNTCTNNTWGIYLHSSSSNTLTNNNCSDNFDSGIYLYNSSSNTLTNNNCSSNNLYGIWFESSSSNNTLTTNVLSSNTNYGIYLVTSTTNIIHSNWIWGNGDNNITGSLSGNYIYENFFYPLGEGVIDHDGDGLTDVQEIAIGTSPIIADTDGDYFMDSYEYTYGTDPLDSSDYPTPPTVDIISPTSSVYGQTSVTLAYSASKGTVTIFTDGIANTTAQSSGSLLFELAEGTHNITIVVVDHEIHIAKQTVIFTVDITLPMVSISSPTSSTYDQDSVTLTYSVSEGTVTIYTNGVANTTDQSSGSVLSDLADGTYTITIIAVDEAGNIGMATITFTIETTTSTPTSTTIIPTTTAASGSFPSIFLMLVSFTALVVVIRRFKKT
ncbi:hypothetical protein CEE45_17645 [Candidatus Heimdallarchaeota archaeon B3_Heim]|nr:MAG: hypothetical protein CEE45_17645 [Candidatus Heimdallarchaeota archaeon B3_Heim]